MKTFNVLSLGAGVQSTAMALMANDGLFESKPDWAIFADTGIEPPWVYENLERLNKVLDFPIHIASKGNLKKDMLKSAQGGRFAGIPFFTANGGMLRQQCTREYKVEVILQKNRNLTGLKPRERGKGKVFINQWIGISTDEAQRMKPAREGYIENIWPLIDKGMSRGNCLEYLKAKNWPEVKKSSCIGCPYHDNKTWLDLKENHPEVFAEAVEIDKACRGGVRGTTEKLYLHRSLKPLDQIDFEYMVNGQSDMFAEECEGMCGV